MNELSIQTYDLEEICNRNALDYICTKTKEYLSQRALKTIINAFYKSTVVTEKGMLYFRITDLAQILRTGGSGAERVLIYQGIEGVYSPAEIISIGGKECISGPTLCQILDYRINTSSGYPREYLKFSSDVYNELCFRCNELRENYYSKIKENRNRLKKGRIKKYNITCCEFTGKKFRKLNEVEFAHIDAVVVYPDKALSIDNGVIILKEIHAELTKKKVLTFKEMYQYCQKKRYNLDWANYVE